MIIIGGEDKILPSKEEGRRLLSILTEKSPHSKGLPSQLLRFTFVCKKMIHSIAVVVDLVEFPDRGHSMLDDSVNLLAVMAASMAFKDLNLNEGN